MAAKFLNYYASANTARGFVTYFEDNLTGIDKIYILKGGSDEAKSSLIVNIGINWFIKGYDVELIHSASDEEDIEAVIIPALGIAVVNGDVQYMEQTRTCSSIGEIIDFKPEEALRSSASSEDLIASLLSKVQELYKLAYKQFQNALRFHSQWEKVYLDNVDFGKLDEIADAAIKNFLSEMSMKKEGIVRNRFLGGATFKGSVDFVMDLTRDLRKRYFLKGRPGSGKSTILKKLADAAQKRGFDVELYHCVLDPQSLDMVIIRELELAVFDSTTPHEYFPSRDGDEIIDIYSLAITPGTDEKYRDELDSIIGKYKEAVNSGVSFLAKAKELQNQIKTIMGDKFNLESIDKMYLELVDKLNAYVNNLIDNP